MKNKDKKWEERGKQDDTTRVDTIVTRRVVQALCFPGVFFGTGQQPSPAAHDLCHLAEEPLKFRKR